MDVAAYNFDVITTVFVERKGLLIIDCGVVCLHDAYAK